MAFDEVFVQVLELLQRQGWTSYHTLRRRFGLDEAALAALTRTLLETQPVTVDDTGSRLVWQGELRPVAAPTRTWDVVPSAPSVAGAAPWPLVGDRRRGLSPLVGRTQEVALLRTRWAQVQAGQGQVVALSGEAGIGKSRLVQVLTTHVADTPHRRWACHGAPTTQYSAFAPVIDLLQQVVDYQPDDPPAVRLHKLEATLASYNLPLPEAVPLLAALLAVPLTDRYAPLTLTPERQRQRTLETVLTVLRTLAARQPGLLIVEDLHWVDPSTLELLSLLVAQAATARLYVLLTWRPEFQPPWPPPAHLTGLTLGRLLPTQVEQLATHVAGGKALPAAVLAQIIAKTEGVPLFVEELTKMVLAAVWLREREDHYELTGPLPPLAIPPTVQDSIVARLEQLGGAKAVAQVGAVWGRGFTEAQIQAVAPLDRRHLAQALARLVEADIVQEVSIPPRVTYVFKHALIQEAAYALLPLDVRQQVHGQVAQALAEQFPATVETQPELLAQHYTAAGLPEPAIAYWQQAGQRASARSAYVEATHHLTQGLELLQTLPDSPKHTRQELTLQTALGVPLLATRGFAAPEVEKAYARARELCQQVGDAQQLFPVLCGLWGFYNVRGELQTARELGEQLLSLAQRQPDPMPLVLAHRALGDTLVWLGEVVSGRGHLEQSIALYVPQQHRALTVLAGEDPGVVCLSFIGWVLWFLGYPDQALQRNHEAIALARELSHPLSLTRALFWAARLHQLRREWQATQARVEEVIALSSEQGYAYRSAQGTLLQGWVLAEQGQRDEGIAQMRQGLTAFRATGGVLGLPHHLGLLAQAYGNVGQVEAGRSVLDEALAVVENTGERRWEAELYRLKGELLWQQTGSRRQQADMTSEAETCLRQALATARRQQGKSLELQAAMSLSRLWLQQGRRAEAHDLLAPVYGWFTEGFDTADLQEAKALLDALA